MKKTSTFFLCALLCALGSFAQISFTGSSSAITTPVNAPAVVVDNTLSITSASPFDGANVSISQNFNSGDILSYTGSLPAGVTANYNSTTGVLSFTGNATASAYETLLRTVTFQTSSSNASQRNISFNLGSAVAFGENGHLYEFIPGSYTWTAAQTDVASRTMYGLQGYLATITSSNENNFITQKLASNGWIGASDDYTYINAATGATTFSSQSASEGKWYWVTGPEKGTQFSNGNSSPTQLTFMNWNSSEPNNSGGNEHYGQIFASSSVGKWNDLPNTSTLGYVVEYGGLAGDPSVDIIHNRPVRLIATSLRGTGSNNVYQLQAPPVTVDNSLTVYSASNITNATVTVSSGFKSGDVLNYNSSSLPSGVTGSYNSTTGVLSFTGTAAPSAWQNLLRTITFYSTSYTVGNRSVSVSLGNLISGSNGHFYEYIGTTADWGVAKTNAEGRTYLGLQGYLATITTQDENDLIQQKLSANAWIGASDRNTYINAALGYNLYDPGNQASSEGKWYWVTGPEKGTQLTTANAPNGTSVGPAYGSSYNNWNLGEPNNSSSSEHYAQIYSSGANPGKWNDLNGSTTLPYVVEYGGMSSDPLLELSASRTIVITSVLPVHGLRFDAVKKDNSAVLTWSTESEENTARFDVLHSFDGAQFSKVGEVAATQNSTTKTNYSFTHEDISPGMNYYKLNIVNQNGRTTSSEVRQVISKLKTTIYPNPAETQVTVYKPFGGSATMVVRNAGGALVMKKPINQLQTVVDITTLPAGAYFIEIVQENIYSETIRLMKK